MPNANTFSVKPIGDFVQRYLGSSKVSIDPFARNFTGPTYTNDLNPDTSAQNHKDVVEWLGELAAQGIKADLGILDQPYSPRQISECYKRIGRTVTMEDTQSAVFKQGVRNALMPCLTSDAAVLSFGWNTVGMGKKRGFEILEILLCCHGGDHNDTICLAERRLT